MHATVAVLALLFVAAVAGCVSEPAEPDDPPIEPAPPVIPDPISFAESGRTEGYFCFPAGCRVVVGSEDVALPVNSTHFSFNATYTWDPVDPTLETLEVFLLRYPADGAWQWEESPDSYWFGTSPLTIESNVADTDVWRYVLHARAKHDDPAGAGLSGGFSQQYEVTGVIQEAPRPAESLIDPPGNSGNETATANITS